MPSYVTPKRNAEFVFVLGLVDSTNSNVFKSGPTLAAGDVQVSKDFGALANISTLPTAIGKMVQVTLSATEMDADNVTVVFSDQSGGEWDDAIMTIQTTAQQIDDLALQSSVDGIGSDIATVDANVDAILVDTDELQQNQGNWATATGFSTHTPADVYTEFTAGSNEDAFKADVSGLATQASVDVVDANVDAILVDTNELQTDWADGGRLDNILDGRASQTSVDTVDANVDSILVDTGTTIPAQITGEINDVQADIAALNDIAAQDVLNATIETNYTLAESVRLHNSVLVGKVSGANTDTEVFRDINDTKDRITATVDEDGNRTAIVIDET